MKLRDRIRGRKAKLEPVDIPEWALPDEQLYLRVLSGTERHELETWMETSRSEDKKVNNLLLMCKMVALTVVDGAGERQFEDADMDWLKDQPGTVLLEIFERAIKLNRMTKADQEELVKNSGNGRPSPSGAGSPAISA